MAALPRKWRQVLELLAGLKIPLNASSGKVLTSDSEGNATWQSLGTSYVAMESPNANLESSTIEGRTEEAGTVTRLKGSFKVKTAELKSEVAVLFTLPLALRPSVKTWIAATWVSKPTLVVQLQVETNGEVKLASAGLPVGTQVSIQETFAR